MQGFGVCIQESFWTSHFAFLVDVWWNKMLFVILNWCIFKQCLKWCKYFNLIVSASKQKPVWHSNMCKEHQSCFMLGIFGILLSLLTPLFDDWAVGFSVSRFGTNPEHLTYPNGWLRQNFYIPKSKNDIPKANEPPVALSFSWQVSVKTMNK